MHTFEFIRPKIPAAAVATPRRRRPRSRARMCGSSPEGRR